MCIRDRGLEELLVGRRRRPDADRERAGSRVEVEPGARPAVLAERDDGRTRRAGGIADDDPQILPFVRADLADAGGVQRDLEVVLALVAGAVRHSVCPPSSQGRRSSATAGRSPVDVPSPRRPGRVTGATDERLMSCLLYTSDAADD